MQNIFSFTINRSVVFGNLHGRLEILIANRALFRIILVVSVFLGSLILINHNHSVTVREILLDEENIFHGRFSTARNYIDGTITPVNMMNSHMVSSLRRMKEGSMTLPTSGPPDYYPDLGIYELSSPSGIWNAQGIDREYFTNEFGGFEITVAQAMGDMFESILQIRPETAWIYYQSSHDFFVISPAGPLLSSEEFRIMHELPFWTDAVPENNPEGKLIVTDIYEDLGGKGLMVTISKPVVVDGDFYGVLCMDITLVQLSKAISLGRASDPAPSLMSISTSSRPMLSCLRRFSTSWISMAWIRPAGSTGTVPITSFSRIFWMENYHWSTA